MRLVNRPETFYRPVPRHGSACRQHRFSLPTVFYIGFLLGVGDDLFHVEVHLVEVESGRLRRSGEAADEEGGKG